MSRSYKRRLLRFVASTMLAMSASALCPSQAQAQGLLVPNPSNLDFGDQRVGIETGPSAVNIANIGDAIATDISCAAVNRPPFNDPADPASFSISGCPTTLAVSANVDINITFTPHRTGAIGALLEINYDSGAGSESFHVGLDGSGIDGPDLVVNGDWSDIDTGEQHVDTGPTTPALQVSLENPHPSDDLTVSAVQLVETSCDQFNFSFPTLPLTLSAGVTHFFSITFDPSDFGIQTCELAFVSDDPDLPDTVTVKGTGINQAILVTPFGYDFGAIDVSGGAVIKDFYIANDGDLGDLTVSGISLTGADCSAFGLSGVPTAPFNIAPGDIEVITAAFDPPVPGAYECTIEILSNDPGAAITDLPLVGTGINADPIFVDGFETGTTDRWSVVVQ